MGSYYPGHSSLQSLPTHSEAIYSPSATHDIGGHLADDGFEDGSTATTAARYCSVRGCSTALAYDYPHKMCEVCRGRHRTYASTKRAKRKQEKAMLGAQAGMAWMPDDADVSTHSAASTSSLQPAPGPENLHPAPSTPREYTFAPSSWDSALDPRLFQPQSSSSELAGALSMPIQPSVVNRFPRRSDPEPLSLPGHPVLPLNTPEDSSGLALPSNGSPGGNYDQSSSPSNSMGSENQSPSRSVLHPRGVISAKSISEAAAQMEGSLPPRYCSIKGCKTLIAGDSFFKMCEPCRDRYRNYGTTKRKKWKKEKEEAIAEMEQMREEENKRRIESGLSPLSQIDAQLEWQTSHNELAILSPHPNLPPSSAPRMCTVSHCREILPGAYLYLRCERHRIQNRHHSKLKRVRDKESKAQAEEEWAASVGGQPPTSRYNSEDRDDFHGDDDEQHEALFREDSSSTPLPSVMDIQGIPPPARGARRTNHVCSIKPCYNLLSPTTPWKMCDTCRARDRDARRIKALRDSGIMVEPLPPRVTREKKDKKKKKAKANTDAPSDEASADAPSLVFMDPLLPERLEQPPAPDYPDAPSGGLAFVMADEEGNITEPPSAINDADPPAASESVSGKQKKKRKAKAPDTSTLVSQAPQAPSAPPMMSLPPIDPLVGPPPLPPPPPPPAGTERPPQQFPFPYYVPPYVMPQYSAPPGMQFPYGLPGMPPPGYPRDMYPPPPMYAPQYAPYPPYPPPYNYPYTFARPPDPVAPPPSTVPAVPPSQQNGHQSPMSAMMSTFSARPVGGAEPREPSRAHDATTYGQPSGDGQEASTSSQAVSQRKRKQPAGSEETNTTKRLETTPLANAQGAVVPAPNPNPTLDPGHVAQAQTYHGGPEEGAAIQGATHPEQRVCSNKACHRTIAAASTSTLCDRCRERMKKRAMKVKQRYRLEPRKLAASSGHEAHSLSEEERGSVERQM